MEWPQTRIPRRCVANNYGCVRVPFTLAGQEARKAHAKSRGAAVLLAYEKNLPRHHSATANE